MVVRISEKAGEALRLDLSDVSQAELFPLSGALDGKLWISDTLEGESASGGRADCSDRRSGCCSEWIGAEREEDEMSGLR